MTKVVQDCGCATYIQVTKKPDFSGYFCLSVFFFKIDCLYLYECLSVCHIERFFFGLIATGKPSRVVGVDRMKHVWNCRTRYFPGAEWISVSEWIFGKESNSAHSFDVELLLPIVTHLNLSPQWYQIFAH